MADSGITWMHSGQAGAPQMSGASTEGQMFGVLDAALIEGFNPQTAVSVTKTATTATLTYAAAHGYELMQLVLVSGATDSKLNGKWRVIEKTNTSITLDAVGVTTLTGTIVTKIAPLGFESIFGKANAKKRAYRSANLNGTRTVLFLDSTLPTGHGYSTTSPAKRVMVDLCKDMTVLGTQIESYTSTFNSKTTIKNGKMFWYQARGTNKADDVYNVRPSEWVIVGNGDYFYFLTSWQQEEPENRKQRDFYAFGDMPSLSTTDKHNCFWAGAVNPNDANAVFYAANKAGLGGDSNLFLDSPSGARGFFIKPHNGIGDMQSVSLTCNGSEYETLVSGRKSGDGTLDAGLPYPNAVGNSLLAIGMYLRSKTAIRAKAVNLYATPQNFNNDLTKDLTIIDGYLLIALSADDAATIPSPYGFFLVNLRG